MLDRLVSLGSRKTIAEVRASGLDDVVPADLKPSARAYVDPRTGKLFSRTAVQTATTFYRHPDKFRTLAEATPRAAARERVLEDAGLSFPARDWSARADRDRRVDAITKAYARSLDRRGQRLPPAESLWAPGSEFRAALDRLSAPTPPGTKEWHSSRAERAKVRALETLGLRPRGWTARPGHYTASDLAAAWRAAGVSRPPKLKFR